MPLPFSAISTLLSRLENIECHEPRSLPKEKTPRLQTVVESWFKSHRRAINELDVDGATALLSTLLPERRTDRVYGIKSAGLCRILSRVLRLSVARARDLQAYQQPGRGDLAECLERVLQAGGPPARPPVTLQEVDGMLQTLATGSRFSDPSIRLPSSSSEARDTALSHIFLRASPVEGKWLVRLILKDFSPVRIDEHEILRAFHFLLPDILRFQNSFGAALILLKGPLQEYPEHPDRRSETLHRRGATEKLVPAVGVKVGRPNFYKARSIAQCKKMIDSKKWVIERKYDGEYCEIHIDLSKPQEAGEWIKIFSKSGKDSTLDKQALHRTLIECLRLGTPECRIKHRAILLGELAVYSDETRTILPFEKIRKHVSRSGVSIGALQDSQPHPHEHLAIVFFDLLLLDDQPIMNLSIETRRMWLRETYRKIQGRAMSAEWKIIDFSESTISQKRLVEQFAMSIAQRCEGLVLKPCDAPYVSLGSEAKSYDRSYIKLKKDYILEMGDEADFAIIGASYSPQQALRSDVKNLKWTHFHLGCLTNKGDVKRFDERPVFRLVGTIGDDHCIPRPILQSLTDLGQYRAKPFIMGEQPAAFDIRSSDSIKMDVIFERPLVVEVLGSGFEKPSNCKFFMLRHPRMTKMHGDRSWKDCVSYQELQQQAESSRNAPDDSESQETLRWIEKLERKSKRKTERERTLTPRSRTTATPSTVQGSDRSARHEAVLSSQLRTDNEISLSGNTMVDTESAGPKRRFSCTGSTPCPPAKHRKSNDAGASRNVSCAHESHSTPQLVDITNTADKQSTRARKQKSKGSDLPATLASSLLISSSPSSAMPARYLPSPGCAQGRCLLARSVIHLAACITASPYIVDDLLPQHDVTVTGRLHHWDRDSFAYSAKCEVVSESQAFIGLRKIVLVEVNRKEAAQKTIRQIIGLNQGRFRERVEVYDWRVLEKCNNHDISAEMLKRHFIGATMFDEGRERTMFVSKIPGFCYLQGEVH